MSDRQGLAGLEGRGLWIVRIGVLVVAIAVIGWFGPSAWHRVAHAASARAATQPGQLVELDRVGFLEAPAWLRSELLPEVMAELEPRLVLGGAGDPPVVGVLDEDGARALKASLEASPWVVRAVLKREFPNRFRIGLDVREPLVLVEHPDGRAFSIDRRGTCLPPVRSVPLPYVGLVGEWQGVTRAPVLGQVHPDPRVLAAVDVALEWRDQLLPLMDGFEVPDLVEIDTFNLEERQLVDAHHPDVLVLLRRRDGDAVSFGWGRPRTTEKSRVPVGTKAKVLRAILGEFPGLRGLVKGDLRFENRWREWVSPSPGPDPAGPQAPG